MNRNTSEGDRPPDSGPPRRPALTSDRCTQIDEEPFFKGGHNDTTANQAICVEKDRRCVVFLSNDVRAESLFQRLAEATVGDPGMPWAWESYTPYDQPVPKASSLRCPAGVTGASLKQGSRPACFL